MTDPQLEALLERVKPTFEVVKKKDATIEEWWTGNMQFHVALPVWPTTNYWRKCSRRL